MKDTVEKLQDKRGKQQHPPLRVKAATQSSRATMVCLMKSWWAQALSHWAQLVGGGDTSTVTVPGFGLVGLLACPFEGTDCPYERYYV